MRRWPPPLALLALALAAPVVPAAAGPAPGAARPPYIGYVFPSGGQRGTSVDVKVGGENVTGATAAIVSGPGVTVQVVDAGDPTIAMDDKKKKKKKQNQTVLDEIITLKVTIAPDAEPGPRDLCLAAPNGLTNKRVFQVGELAEVRETEPNDRKAAPKPLPDLPLLVNGQILPGDVDRFRFHARKGQNVVVEVSARALIPYIADAVPGWFQAVVALRDARDREVALADDYRFNPDPVLFYEIPSDGDYDLVIWDSIYRGREDFVYRIRIGELPFITGVFPLGAPRGPSPVPVHLSGVNLPSGTLRVPVDPKAPAEPLLSVARDGLRSNAVPFEIDTLPEVLEAAAPPGMPQDVSLPVIVNGRIREPGEQDTFRFSGRKGLTLFLEVRARRLGSPLDSRLALFDSRGAKVAENDDAKDPAEGLLTHQADSALRVTLPEDGRYTLVLADIQGKGGDAYAYRLHIGPPLPDFELRATPSELALPPGGAAELIVHALRQAGFDGEIRIALHGPDAAGLSLDGAVIPAGADRVSLTVSASEGARPSTRFPSLRGTALVKGRSVTRPVVPAEQLMQAFIYQHLVSSDALVLKVADAPAPFVVTPRLPADGRVTLVRGKTVTLPVSVTRRPGFDRAIRLTLDNPPKGITVGRSGALPGRDTGLLSIRVEDDAEAVPDGNLVFTALMTIPIEGTAAADPAGRPAGAADPKPKEATRPAPRTDKSARGSEDKTGASAASAKNVPPGGTPASAGKEGKPASPAAPEAKKPGSKLSQFQRILVTVPAIPFRLAGDPPPRKPAPEAPKR